MFNQKINCVDEYISMPNHKIRFPSLDKYYDFDEIEESDYEYQESLIAGKYYFKPYWTNLIQVNSQQNFENINFFCPICGKYVSLIQSNYECVIQKIRKKFLGHKRCIEQSQITQLVYYKTLYNVCKGYMNIQEKKSTVGGQEYLLSVNFFHELRNVKYLKLQKKMITHEGLILVDFQNQKNSSCLYVPNLVVVPSPHFKIQIDLKSIGGCKNRTFNQILSLDLTQIYEGIKNNQSCSIWVIKSQSNMDWIVNIQIQLIFDKYKKQKIIEIMNYKFFHSIIDDLPLIKINKLLFQQKIFVSNEKVSKFQIEKTNACSSNSQILEQYDKRNKSIFSMRFKQTLEIQSDIIVYSKTQLGSKVLQKKLKQMDIKQIDQFIQNIIPHLQSLLTDDYANYMIQTLIGVSNQLQRIKIFINLQKITYKLVCSKQGTFAFQQIIEYVKSSQEQKLFYQIAKKNFVNIAKDTNGNHFLRKLINKLPFQYIMNFIEIILQNFLELVNNKNSVCVLKIILRLISKEFQTQQLLLTKQKIILVILKNRQIILKHQYGNYFIQEAYQNFNEILMKDLSQQILNKFQILSKLKFSSNIICKCISTYWKRTNYYQTMIQKITKNGILELFYNKQGNKVLLQLISLREDNTNNFKAKIIKTIQNKLPSKFNTNKWVKNLRIQGHYPIQTIKNKFKQNKR